MQHVLLAVIARYCNTERFQAALHPQHYQKFNSITDWLHLLMSFFLTA